MLLDHAACMGVRPVVTLLLTSLACTATLCQSRIMSVNDFSTRYACHRDASVNKLNHPAVYTRLSIQIEALTAAQVAFTRVGNGQNELSKAIEFASDRPSPSLLRQRLLCAVSIIRGFHATSSSDRMFKRDLLKVYLESARAVAKYQAVFQRHQSKDVDGNDNLESVDREDAHEASVMEAVAGEHLQAIAQVSISPIMGKRTGSGGAQRLVLTCREASILRSRLSAPLRGEPSIYSITARMFSDSLARYGCS